MLDGKDEYLIANLRDHIERLKYTFKTQQKAADKYDLCEKIRIIFGAVLTATASGTFIAMLFEAIGRQTAGALATSGIATIATLVATVGEKMNFASRARGHRQAGDRIRDYFYRFEDVLSDYEAGAITSEEARIKRDELESAVNQILPELPHTTKHDYNRAEDALETNEHTSTAQDTLFKKKGKHDRVR